MTNPLAGLSRPIKVYTKLPSNGQFYDDSTLKVTTEMTGEYGVRAMTSNDELMFKNPDALLNGHAMTQVLSSCVNGLVNPKKLLVNDVDALIIAIRIASFGDDMDLSIKCPECGEEGTYGLDLHGVLANMTQVENEYKVDLQYGTIVFIKPYLYEDTLKASLATFEQTKKLRHMNDPDLTDDDKMRLFTQSFNALMKSNVEMLANCIVRVVNEEKEIDVYNDTNNRSHILDFIKDMEKTDSDIINDKIKEINSYGVDKNVKVVCQKCEHGWDTAVEFDPVTFFTGS